jgi:hypothetical protein
MNIRKLIVAKRKLNSPQPKVLLFLIHNQKKMPVDEAALPAPQFIVSN